MSLRIDIDAVGAAYGTAFDAVTRRVVICAGTGCLSAGALEVRDAFVSQL